VLLTPDRSLHWSGGRLMAAPGLGAEQQPHALSPEQWRATLEELPWL
jgi:hypothetical protein